MKAPCFAVPVFGLCVVLSAYAADRTPTHPSELRRQARDAFSAGNWNDAFVAFQKFIFEPGADPGERVEDIRQAADCLTQLGREDELDSLREKMAEAHARVWPVLQEVARSYAQGNHSGFIIAGTFHRGSHRGGGEYANAIERDRARSLQLMDQAMPLVDQESIREAAGQFYLNFAGLIMEQRDGDNAWRLGILTDLSTLPDYEEGYPYYYYRGYGSGTRGTPVDEEGNPIVHRLPESYVAAQSDGECWRWLLYKSVEIDPDLKPHAQYRFAEFLHHQFGVETLADYRSYFYRARSTDGEDRENTSGTYELHTLRDDETIARLANGVKRFPLPPEYNYIQIYKELNAGESGLAETAGQRLAEIYENRRQFPRAAEYWRNSISRFGAGHERWKEKRLDQIIGNWGEFEPAMTQPGRDGAALDYRFRNGTRVQFVAHQIDVKALLDDLRDYLESDPVQLDWRKIDLNQMGYRLVQENEMRYLGEQVASWDLDLEPLSDHFDQRITIKTPLREPGAYLVTARMERGNVCKIILWLNDTVIVKMNLDSSGASTNLASAGPAFYFVADARTGKPVAHANVELFGYWQKNLEKPQGRRFVHTYTTRFAEFTDAEGQLVPSTRQMLPDPERNAQWLVTATTEDGRFAYLGFSGVWRQNYYDYQYNETKVYGITDRPVYRPQQSVKFKFWVRHAQYDQEDTSDFAGQSFTVRITDSQANEIYKSELTADEFGGVSGELALPADAALGVYGAEVVDHGGTTFRVEEYKKPEFEVSIEAPTEPVMLGEKFAATIKAAYYFGASVTQAKVKYKVTRTEYDARWYPPAPWDWFYGLGYWWFACDYDWYPGWRNWGCLRPLPFWWPRPSPPPEVVAESETEIGEDGTVKVEIDTALAREMQGDTDHRYQISAEVTDSSRRTITGQGQVLVARKPFQVYAWVDRGYYRPGDVIHAEFSARTLDQKPVPGKGRLRLFRITYEADRKPEEKVVEEWDLDADEEGRAAQTIRAARPGQYRLSFKLTDRNEHQIEGGYVFVVRGQETRAENFRFNGLELIPDKREYQPGEKVQLLINTEQENSTILLFVRPANGVYLKPKVIHALGQSAQESIEVMKKDMPNFFVEAVTISDGRVYSEMREIVVPPEKRVLNVEVLPSAEEFKPGENAHVRVRLTDYFGEPFVGSTVMTVYDKAVEYISGGSNVPEIKEFFWKWRRQHHPATEHNFDEQSFNLVPKDEIAMAALGIFGDSVADELDGRIPRRGLFAGRSDKMARMAAPASMAVDFDQDMSLGMELADAAGLAAPEEEKAAAEPMLVQPTVRKEFADTAFWIASLLTDGNGEAQVEFKMPENLTGWKIRTWAMGHGTQVGEGTAEVVTTKNLLLRLQAPRFFVEKDEVVLSANIHNYLESEKNVQAVLELEGETLEPLAEPTQTVKVAAGGEARVDWRVKVVREGEAIVRMKALSDEESDAMQMNFPVYVHGMLKTDSYSGALRPEQDSGQFEINVPTKRRPEQTRLEIRYSPTLAGALVDALPYLADYPYGCTEQTLSRFLPAVLTRKILQEMGVDLKVIQEKRTNLNAQEIGEDRERAEQWKRYDRNPVFDEETLDDMVKEGMKRLYDMQLSDGGWGWFSGYGEFSSAHTTAYVVHGLQEAKESGLAVIPDALERGITWLKNYQAEQIREIKDPEKGKSRADELDAFVYMVLADAGDDNSEMRGFLDRDRKDLAVYGKAMFALALDQLGRRELRDAVIRNIEQFLVEDAENQTAYLRLENEGCWWYWYGSEYEAQAYYLKLLARTNPKGGRASGLVKYLLNNRKNATYWNSTRDTAICLEAMTEYLRASGEDKPNLTVEIIVDGRKQKEVGITSDHLFDFDNQLVLEGEALTGGKHNIEFRKKGTGPLYFNAYLTTFSLEDYIPKAGLEIRVNRKFYKLTRAEKKQAVEGSRGQAVDQKVEKYERKELADLDTLKSGDLVEVELEIESKNDYEYLVFEDMKAAGFEPVDVRSGYNGNALGAYVEFRDNRVVFFVRQLARGRHSVAYRLRAEIPGKFSALPTRAHAMYAPELKANSAEIKLGIED